MSKLVRPHGGGGLKPLLVGKADREGELRRAESLRAVPMTSRETSDLVMLAMGAYSPLEGFMGHDDWRRVCVEMKLSSGLFWPIPITLSCEQDLADSIGLGEDVALLDQESGQIMATMTVTEKYGIDIASPGDRDFVSRRLAQRDFGHAGRAQNDQRIVAVIKRERSHLANRRKINGQIGDQTAGGDAGPPFAVIAETAADRTDDLRAWLADPHPPMPNLSLTNFEIDDLLAYIGSLRQE